jgi:hypothetical protein
MWEKAMNDFEIRIVKYNKSHKNSTILRDIKTALESVFGEQYEVVHLVEETKLAINIAERIQCETSPEDQGGEDHEG